MLEITIMNCEDKEVQWEWGSKREFVDTMDGDDYDIPMLDDALTAVDTDDDEIATWWRNSDGITVNDLYEECRRELADGKMKFYHVFVEWKDDKVIEESTIAHIQTKEQQELYDEGEYEEVLKDTSYSDDDILYYFGCEETAPCAGQDCGDFVILEVRAEGGV